MSADVESPRPVDHSSDTATPVPAPERHPGRGRSSVTPKRAPVTPKDVGVLIGFLVIAFAVAALGTLSTIHNVDGWYAHAFKAAWNVPNWLFAPVWVVLYALMAIGAWMIWRRRIGVKPVTVALSLYIVQLILNSLWTPVFFGAYPGWGPAALWIAFAIIVLLDIAVAATIASFLPLSRVAGWMLVPYLLWILFASTLNWALAALNS